MLTVAAGPEIPFCTTCRQQHIAHDGTPGCTGHSRGRLRPEIAGKPCRTRPMHGQKVCKNHGGKAPQALAAGAARTAREDAEAQMAALAVTFGDVPEDSELADPAEIVAEQILWRQWHVRWLRKRVQELDPDALVWGVTKVTEGDVVVGNGGSARLQQAAGATSEAKPNIWLALYHEWSRDLEKLCIEAIRVGLDERRVRLAEQQADAVVRVMDGVLTELGHDPTDVEVAEVVERNFRLLAGGA